MRLEISMINPEETPSWWLTEGLRSFSRNSLSGEVARVEFKGEVKREAWISLGAVLMKDLILPYLHWMTIIEGEFPVDIIDLWIKSLRTTPHARWVGSCFNYVGYPVGAITDPESKYRNLRWTSTIPGEVSPFGAGIFDVIPREAYAGCNILIAGARRRGIKGIVQDFAQNPEPEFIYQHMESWVSPLSDCTGYYVGVLEGESGWDRVFDLKWLENRLVDFIQETGI